MLRSLLLFTTATSLLTARAQQFSAARPLNFPEAGNVQDVATGDWDNDGDADIVIGTDGGHVSAYFNDGTGVFGAQVRLAAANRAYQVIPIDLDNDGDLDITWANWGSPDVAWCKNLGGGVFAARATLVDDLTANTACSISWADVDEDGHMDLFASTYINGQVAWYRNNGSEVFGPRQGIVNCPFAWVCATADMDGDGDIDVVTAGDGVSWRDNQNHQFNGQLPYNGGYIATDLNDVRGMVLYDWGGDGYPDIFVAEAGNDRVVRYQNDGTGNYSIWGYMTEYATNVAGVEALRLLDLNGDGYEEMLAACADDNSIRLLDGGGNSYVIVSGVLGASGMAVADFNGDGYPDLVTTAAEASEVAVYAGNGSYEFTPMQTLTQVGGNVFNVAIGDVDGDGLGDIVEGFYGGQAIGWKRNLGGDTYGPVTVVEDNAPGVQSVLLRDLDNDGDLDLVSSYPSNPKRLVWYRNNGSGGFTSEIVISTSATPGDEFDLGDFDADGDLDLAAVDGNASSIVWFENQGTGDFEPPVTVAPSLTNVRELICADVNGDGASEIVFYKEFSGGTMVCMNNGTGTFALPTVVHPSLSQLNDLKRADLNGDGFDDVVIDRATTPSLLCMGSNGDGTFTTLDTADVNDGWMYGSLTIGDMDGDGDQDLVAAATNLHYLFKWFANDGSGQFSAGDTIDVGGSAAGWQAGDMDADGDPDLLVAIGEDLDWYENFIGSPYSAGGRIYYDVDGSGTWNTGDVAMPTTGVVCAPSASVPYSGADGQYRFVTDPQTYTLSAAPPAPWWQVSNDPPYHVVTLTDADPVQNGLDFGFGAAFDTLVVNVTSSASPVRCDMPYMRWLDVVNIGTQEAQVQLDYVPDGMETILSTDPPADQLIGNVQRWNFTLPLFGTKHIALLAENEATPLDHLRDSVYAHITAPGSVLNRAVVHHRNVLCAFDPNDKQVEPVGYGEFGAIDINTERLTYTVRFQNTGTDTAYTVMVRDRLNEWLDPATIQVLGTSHPLTALNVENDGEAVFLFNNILLPDSNVNEPASHGYVVFSIAVRAGTPEGSSITNSVDIYFGNNEAVTTNTTLNTLVDCSAFTAEITWIDGATLLANEGAHYQWYLNGDALPGHTLQVIFIPELGEYTVQVTTQYGCTALSEPFAAISTGIAVPGSAGMAVVPNPMSTTARVLFPTAAPVNAVLEVVDMQGRVLLVQNCGGVREAVLDRTELAAGAHLLRLVSGGQVLAVHRLMVQ